MGLLSRTKDRVIESLALPLLNGSLFQPYGRATRLRIDSAARTLELDLELTGETELLRVQVGKYELVQEGDCIYAILREIQTSKAWLTAVAVHHLQDRRLEIPPRFASLLFGFL